MPNAYYFIGIGGIGMSALAQLLSDRGDRVVGSDRSASPVTDMLKEKGITVYFEQDGAHLTAQTTLVVYSAAVPEDHPERKRAEELGIGQVCYFEMLGRVAESKRTIAVAGTHGKTTTTGMLARILMDAKASPTVVVGSIVTDLGSNYVRGNSDLFVVEACEYHRHFLNLTPTVLVITNLEFDHSDYFRDLADVQDAFRAFIQKVPAEGVIVTDIENPNIAPLLEGVQASVVHYPSEAAYPLQLPGEFNVMNAKAATAAARAVAGVTPDVVAHALMQFKGTWRRFEYKGRMGEVDVYDDYAHHPTAIQETIRALKAKAKGRVLLAFHPHLFSRTRDLFDGFVRSFTGVDELIIAPIFAARETDDGTVSSELLAQQIRAEGVPARAVASLAEVEAWLRENARPGDTIMTMGAGDIYTVADRLVA